MLCGIKGLILLTILFTTNFATAQSVPFVIRGDDATKTATDFSRLLDAPAGKSGFVQVRNGKFYTGEKRLRFWGMNLCFGACFPTHDEADRIAPHMAKLGINAVRFHHMDMQDAPNGIWKTSADGSRSLDPDQIDRLDYFLAKLHENGIFANLNLHVSRTLTEKEGFPQLKDGPWWASSNKWVMYFDPDVQAELKTFCRELLSHKNPYRKLKRVDDPGIAVLEMLNENFFSVKGTSLLDKLPKKYVDSFQAKWNQWLVEKYTNHETMVAAWKPKSGATETLVDPARWDKEDLGKWAVNSPAGKKLVPKFNVAGPNEQTKAIRFVPVEVSKQRHFQQLTYRPLSVEKGQPYTISYWVRADEEREYSIEVSTTDGGEWRPLGIFDVVKAGPEWKRVVRNFFPEESVRDNAYVAFSFGNDDTPIELAEVKIQSGIKSKQLDQDQRLEKRSVGVPGSSSARAAHADLKQFMVDTERAWIVELKRFLVEDLKVKVPITASQENYHAPGVLADTVDFVDLHNYWHHPTFPTGKDFNSTEYRTGNVPIETDPLQSNWPARSLLIRTGWRYHGMPFTLSEWNHAEPGDVNTGAIMMAATIGAIQDWDGIFFFDYESDPGVWFEDHYEGFFDFNHQPAKLAVFSMAANIFLREDLKPIQDMAKGSIDDRLDGRLAFQYRIGIDPTAKVAEKFELPNSLNFTTPGESLRWDATDKKKAHLKLNTPNSRGVWGLIANRTLSVGKIQFEIGSVDRNYATLLVTSLDNLPIESSNRLVLLASSGAENTQMQWNEDRTSVSDQWGTGPTLINTVRAQVSLPIKASSVQIFAMDGHGKRAGRVPHESNTAGISFEIDQRYRTLWYEIEVSK